MFYDPIKDRIGAVVSRNVLLQRLFFFALDTVFLRTWHVKKNIRRQFAEWPKDRPLRILDAGTGFGQYVWFLVRTFPQAEILAVDVKQDYLDRAQSFLDRTPYGKRVRWAYADLTQFETDERFDFILSVDVMEHIEDDRAVFRNFAKVLNPDGVVLINTPSDLGGSDADLEGESFISEHVRDGYNKEELTEKLQTAGLNPFHRQYTYGRFGSLAWRFLLKYPLKMLSWSRGLALVLPFWYAVFLLPCLLLHGVDVNIKNPAGTGVLFLSRRAG